ncbi:uncharacterized protein BJ171DRAFT_487119 [Polychytrium aggregatum]|uniref:uncharacterized protein n=1 Tax=Polychytrium aggregatum TaxID=110093 RepID=UPI0022FF09EA|nr:uncharacterized protein BJ171DRAFT_487119 [Polychytrium aggregatum]KAI9209476.1 hypothetical protein BJ171DRAFT_487119 [Polychytrium aggregatum]
MSEGRSSSNAFQEEAAALFASERYKESYHTYLKATNENLVKIARGIEWNNQEIANLPQDILDAFREAHLFLQRAEEIVRARVRSLDVAAVQTPEPKDATQNRLPVGQTLVSDQSFKRSVHNERRSNVAELPVIPVSKLSLQAAQYSALHRNAVAEWNAARSNGEAASLSVLRKLLEDVQIYQSKLESIQSIYRQVAIAPLELWTSSELAKQIVLTNVDLLAKLIPQNTTDPIAVLSSPEAKGCADYARFLEHVAIHAILAAPEKGQPPKAQVGWASAIQHIINAVFVLFYVYRDLAGSQALWRALKSPEVQRLATAWASVSPKTLEVFKHLEGLLEARTPKDHIQLVDEILLHHYAGGGVITVVPCLGYFRDEATRLLALTDQAQVKPDSIDTRAELAKLAQTLELCLGKGSPDQEFQDQVRINAAAAAAVKKPAGKTQKIPTPEITLPAAAKDLHRIGSGNLSLEHWLLTRVFLSKHQLWKLSAICEVPKGKEENPYQDETSQSQQPPNAATSTGALTESKEAPNTVPDTPEVVSPKESEIQASNRAEETIGSGDSDGLAKEVGLVLRHATDLLDAESPKTAKPGAPKADGDEQSELDVNDYLESQAGQNEIQQLVQKALDQEGEFEPDEHDHDQDGDQA